MVKAFQPVSFNHFYRSRQDLKNKRLRALLLVISTNRNASFKLQLIEDEPLRSESYTQLSFRFQSSAQTKY